VLLAINGTGPITAVRSTDSGATWTPQNLPATTFPPGYGSYSHNFTDFAASGDNVVALIRNVVSYTGGPPTVNPEIALSADKGATWISSAVIGYPGKTTTNSRIPIQLVMFDYLNMVIECDGTAGAGNQGNFRSVDGGVTWTEPFGNIIVPNQASALPLSYFTALMSGDATFPVVLPNGTPGNNIMKTVDGGVSWGNVQGTAAPMHQIVGPL
jgi:hypothetical protein